MGTVGTPVYAMLPVQTGAARAEATAFAQEATRRLADQGIDHPADQLVDLIRSQATVTGLYDDGELAGCLVVHPDEDPTLWSRNCPGPGVWVSLVPPVPGRDDQVARLLTLCLADQAAQHELKWVWWKVPATAPQSPAPLLVLLRDLGWEDLPAVRRADGERITPLRLRAERRPAPTVAISASADALPLPAVSSR
ncbi:hypothetical protein ADK90_10510 [Streptomyces sp. XY413]|uniref:hypothetical protein n=1 Tax=Streptomyces sp. XY413 TaxID=1519479 RepID=UPI0006B05EC2|nr:hypothetical protein [Streptomyces sp. XY413]KOV22487.1 hypothetical protein ADK90_10510 [Streptomyces sp. XY413]